MVCEKEGEREKGKDDKDDNEVGDVRGRGGREQDCDINGRI